MAPLESPIIAVFDGHRDYCHSASESVGFSQKIYEKREKEE